jgi:hypothetical protein
LFWLFRASLPAALGVDWRPMAGYAALLHCGNHAFAKIDKIPRQLLSIRN